MLSAHRRHLRERKDLLIVRAALERMTLQTLAAELSPVTAAKQWISNRLHSSSTLPVAGQLLRGGLMPLLLRWVAGRWLGSNRAGRGNKGLAAVAGVLSLGMPRAAKWAGIAGIAWQLWCKLRPSSPHRLSKSRSR